MSRGHSKQCSIVEQVSCSGVFHVYDFSGVTSIIIAFIDLNPSHVVVVLSLPFPFPSPLRHAPDSSMLAAPYASFFLHSFSNHWR